jgi:hypothetical protein
MVSPRSKILSRRRNVPVQRCAVHKHHDLLAHLCSGFINEDKLFLVQIGLARTPLLARLGDIGTVLFGRAQ